MMSGFLTGPELSRDAVKGRLLAEDEVVVVHAAKSPHSRTTASLKAVCFSILFFMRQGTAHEALRAMTHPGDFSVPRSREQTFV